MAALSPLMTVMMRAADKACSQLLRDFAELENLQISEKTPGQFVTAADKRAEDTIHYNLSKDRPEFGFLMEESGEIKGNDPDRRFIIDPIDGTHNFMRGIPHWSISIALEEMDEITAGLIMDPVKNEVFYAEKGKGAFSRHVRLRVSGRRELKSATIGTWVMGARENYPDNSKNKLLDIEDVLRTKCGDFRQMGSNCLEMAYVASGRLDGQVMDILSPWDIAAGAIIIREAGGVISDWKGIAKDAVYAGKIITGNSYIHPELLNITKKAS